MEKPRVAVGMSGGVDSAVSALLLKEQGYDVVGIFMKNWDETRDDTGECTAAEDYDDVRAVCRRLDIPYYTVNFTEQYWQRVFSYFLAEYRRGRTPNPDVLCNREIKFAAFLDHCLATGAQKLATGHYCRLSEEGLLLKGADPAKDQSYFLCMVPRERFARVLFPIGHLQKSEVRRLAQEAGLPVAGKKDSTGICFIGERKFRAFLRQYLPAQPGPMRTLSGELIGQHHGLMYYTLGQRRGLDIGGRGTGERWFVVKKDLDNNTLYVEQGADSPALYSAALTTEDFNWLAPPIKGERELCARFRYRQSDQQVLVRRQGAGVHIEFARRQRAVTPGQYAVLYEGDVCLGGGVIGSVIF